ncbi:MAG TPA: nucleotide exchange factor GrpE [Planctomycetota bacterium]|jgi:molecular chaperone GrpE|nr:nucleotide exchange factor GrpE [Planctomycetota bacterium]
MKQSTANPAAPDTPPNGAAAAAAPSSTPPNPNEIAAMVDKLVHRWKTERGEIPTAQETTDVNLLREDILNAVAALADQNKVVDELRQKIAKAQDDVLRAKADFVNYQERSKRETARMISTGTRGFAEALVPWLDNFELSLKTTAEEAARAKTPVDAHFREAIQLIHEQLLQILQTRGLVQYSAAGQRFDPALHESITKIPAPDKFHGEVIEEVRPGYKWQDMVLRPASVVIADNPKKPYPAESAAPAADVPTDDLKD